MNLLRRLWRWLLDPLPDGRFPTPHERRIETDPTEPPPPVLRRSVHDVGGMPWRADSDDDD